MRVFVLSWLILEASLANGRAHLDAFQELAHAKSASEVSRVVAAFEELKISRAACRIQLKQKKVPVACYESLSLEIKKGLHPRSVKQTQLLARLDEICAESAQKFQIPRELPPTLAVSVKCRNHIAEALEIRRYREQSPAWSEN